MTAPARAYLGADLLVDALEANGFHVVPLNPGASEEIFSSALERSRGVAPVLAYQELTALGFAGGVTLGERARTRASGEIDAGPCRATVVAHGMVGLGGMASFISGFAQQKLPVLILVGNAGVMEDSLGKHQNPNGGLEEMARAAGCKAVISVTSPETLMHQLKRATMLAEGGTPGPVALVIPQNGVMRAPATCDTIIEKIPRVTYDTEPNASAVRELAQRLLSAKEPVILLGDEVARAGAVPAIVTVADQIGAHRHGIALRLIEPGKPNQNAYVESLNGRLRDECLNEHWFTSIAHARAVIETWRKEYNDERPKKSLGGITYNAGKL
jgi:thiamine pyrophosphate-dependent acetolactate synthase large subunit-like protein